MKQRVQKHDLVCLALLLVLLAVMAVGAPYAQAQRVERFNIVPELVVSFVVRPCMLLLLGYGSAWGLAGFFREEPRLRPGAKGPLLAVCGLLTLSYLALVVLYLCQLEGIPWRLYLLIPRYIDSGLPLLLGGGWYAATRQSG